MDTHIKKITITPAKFDENGDIRSHEFATLTLDVPMDSTEQRQAIVELMGLLDQEWVTAKVQARLQRIQMVS